MSNLDATPEPEASPSTGSRPSVGETAPAYSDVVAKLAGGGDSEGRASTGAIEEWRASSGGALAVVLGDAGVASLATLYGAITGATQVSDRHAHRWREQIRVRGAVLESSRFAGAVGVSWEGVAAQTAIYAGAIRLARRGDRGPLLVPSAQQEGEASAESSEQVAGSIVLEAQPESAFWDDPRVADVVMVANGDDTGRVRTQLGLVLSASSSVFMAPQRESIADAVRGAVEAAGASLREVALECKLGKIQEAVDSQKFTIETGGARFDVELPVAGAHQRMNFATALLAAGEVPPQQVGVGLKTLQMPLRFESIKASPRVVVDGAESRPALRALKHAVESVLDPRGLLVLATVDSRSDLGMLAQTVSDLSGEARVAFGEGDRDPADALAERLRELRVGVQLAGAPGPALDQLMSGAGPRDTVLVFGSRRATSEARAYLLGLEQDPQTNPD